MTNAEKFEEVFGFEPDPNSCVMYTGCFNCKYADRNSCTYDFWDEEYQENKDDKT